MATRWSSCGERAAARELGAAGWLAPRNLRSRVCAARARRASATVPSPEALLRFAARRKGVVRSLVCVAAGPRYTAKLAARRGARAVPDDPARAYAEFRARLAHSTTLPAIRAARAARAVAAASDIEAVLGAPDAGGAGGGEGGGEGGGGDEGRARPAAVDAGDDAPGRARGGAVGGGGLAGARSAPSLGAAAPAERCESSDDDDA